MHKLDLTAPQPLVDQPQTTIESIETAVDDLPSESNNRAFVPGHPMKKKNAVIGFCCAAIVAGVATGYGSYRLYGRTGSSTPGSTTNSAVISQIAGENVSAGEVFGSADDTAFKDQAEGYLEAGVINGEGSHKLLRPGGVSQTVYLTSSVTDLDKLVGMEVKIWGETFKAQRAGWLMDVGRVEVVKVQGSAPSEK